MSFPRLSNDPKCQRSTVGQLPPLGQPFTGQVSGDAFAMLLIVSVHGLHWPIRATYHLSLPSSSAIADRVPFRPGRHGDPTFILPAFVGSPGFTARTLQNVLKGVPLNSFVAPTVYTHVTPTVYHHQQSYNINTNNVFPSPNKSNNATTTARLP